MQRGLWWKDLKERDHLENLGMEGENNSKVGFQEIGW